MKNANKALLVAASLLLTGGTSAFAQQAVPGAAPPVNGAATGEHPAPCNAVNGNAANGNGQAALDGNGGNGTANGGVAK
jgi:hypothetical protein